MPNVVLTPHIGGATYDTEVNHSRLIADDLTRLLAGERPVHVCNPEVLQ
jgi:D-3-phosphoglycerate dehydrogenase